MRLVLRVSASLAVIIALSLYFAQIIYLAQYENILTDLQQSRISVVSTNIRSAIEEGIDVGLALKELRNIQQVIERAQALDPDIGTISVFDRSGLVLFDTDPERVGTQPSPGPRWLARAEAGEPVWHDREAGDFVVGAPIQNSFGFIIGSVAVRYSGKTLADSISSMTLRLTHTTGVILAAAAGISLLVVHLVFRPLLRSVRTLGARILELAERPDAAPALPAPALPGADPRLEEELSAFHECAREALIALAEAEHAVVCHH